jgi:gliding motility-associated-like protein
MKTISQLSNILSGKHQACGLTPLILCILFFSLSTKVTCQEYLISAGNASTCSGFLLDSGGNAGDYGANENITATFCAVAPETIINLYWTISALGTGDYIEIFDGPTNGSPLIGSYSSNELQSLDITSTNPSGCLTVHFVSDGTVNGNFGAEISCGPPCERPITHITSDQEPNPLFVCPGEEITFDGIGTEFFNGASLNTFSWNFDDGTSNTASWPSVTHSFAEPGGYKVQLSVTDNNGCTNTNLNDYVVFVSTPPNFNLITEVSDLCSGGEAFIGVTNLAQDSLYVSDSLNNWISNPWIDLPNNFNENGYYIEDGSGGCLNVYFTYNDFPAGAVIDNVSDILSVYANIEHSFMGDLVISLICPNGQTLILHQQGGGGTDLGEAPPDLTGTVGIGYDYYWSPTATNGTFADNNLDPILPAGTYESVDPFTNLIGCPFNGTWNLQICDMFLQDDGNLFNYGVIFNPSLYNGLLNFTPQFGPGCDSTYWTGQGITESSSGCDYINVTLTDPGTYTYVYTAINDFGCTYDTSVTITVDVAPSVTAGPDLTYDCLNPTLSLLGGFLDPPIASCNEDGGTFNYTYNNNDELLWVFCPDNGFEESTAMTFTFISGEMEAIFEELWVYDGADVDAPLLLDWTDGDATGLTFTANNPSGCLTVQFSADFTVSAADGTYQPWNYVVGCEQIAPEFVWEWSPSQYLITPNEAETGLNNLPQTQTFTLTGYPVGQPNCNSTDDVLVTVAGNVEIDVEEFYKECFGDTAHVLAPQILGGTGPFTTKWVSESGEIFNAETIDIVAGGPKMYCAIVEDVCGVADTACTEISAYPEIPATFQVTEPFGCEPHFVLMTSDYIEFQNIGSMTWHFGDGESASLLASSNHEYTVPGVYYPWLTIEDENGCVFTDTMDTPIRIWPTPIAQAFVEPEIAILPNTTFEFTNGTINGESYIWTIDQQGSSTAVDTSWTFPSETAGNYLIKLLAYNQFGCKDSAYVQAIVQDDIDIYVPNSFTPDGDGINDVWQWKGRGFEEQFFSVVVFNRWGEKLYETTDPTAAWTGNYHNGETFVPDGIYFYRITIRDLQNEVGHLYEGHITILR